MIRGRIMAGDKPILLIGLSRKNCMRLLQDQPIHITAEQLAELGLPDGMEVLLIAGESEAALAEQLGGMPLQPEVPGQRFWMKGMQP